MLFTKFLLGMAFAAMLTTGVANSKVQKNEKVVEEFVTQETTARRQTRAARNLCVVEVQFHWTDDEGGVHPLVGAKVNVFDIYDVYGPSYYTDANGYVQITYDDDDFDQCQYLKVSAQNDTANVKVQTRYGNLYSWDFQVNGQVTYNYIEHTFNPANEYDVARAFQLYQAAYYYGMYAKQINHGTSMPMCTFNWPGTTDEGCYYSYNSITISGKTAAAGYPGAWASWDVIGHEYGHHVQRTKGITANPGGTHYINHNNIDDQMSYNGYSLEVAKNRGLKLAWGEGWPTFWSTIAQSTFPADIRNISTVGDTRYTTYQGFWYELDSYDGLRNNYNYGVFGDADEIAVQSILYKLYSPTIDTYDKFAIDVQTLFDIVCNAHPYTFYEFMQAMYNAGYDAHDLGKLLSKFRITPNAINISGNYINLPATFSWTTDKGSSNIRFNQFDFVVLRPNFTELFRVNNISATGSTAYYTPTVNQWNQILNLGTGYYVYVVSRQTLSFVSGNYVSEMFSFNQPTEYYNDDSIMHPADWGFRQQYYFDGQSATHQVDDLLTVNSTRLRCGYIEQSYVVLSAKHNEAGHAYLSLEFNKPVYFYSFDIALWSDSEGINRNNAELVMQVKDEYGDWREEADFLNDYTLPTKDQGFLNYGVWDDDGIYGIRWLETAPATGTKNKGRIAFNNMLFHTALED
jgi:hypothetical protein